MKEPSSFTESGWLKPEPIHWTELVSCVWLHREQYKFVFEIYINVPSQVVNVKK